MDLEAIPLCNKIILPPATTKEVITTSNTQRSSGSDERTRVAQKQKNMLGRSEAVTIKIYGS